MKEKQILLIDDDELLCAVLTSLLSLEGYQVSRAADGEEGPRALAGGHVDLILLDLLMPRMDGIRFLRIFAEQAGPKPPVIVLSASAAGEVLEDIKQVKLADIIRKPVQPGVLLEKVAAALSGGAA